MLDQPDFIKRYDQHDIMGVIAGQPLQLRAEYAELDYGRFKGVTRIVLAGMGGSALAGEFINAWLADRLPLPLLIVRGYDLPAYVDAHTLVIASSYSGNTEESLSCLEQARKLTKHLVIMSAGGKLQEIAERDGLPYFGVTSGLQPRMAVLYGVKALCQLIEGLELLDGLQAELDEVAGWGSQQAQSWAPAVATAQNPAKQIAEALLGHPIVMYGGPTLAMTALKWKIDANENAKHLAFWYAFPEFNHNEFLGWGHPKQSGLRVVQLQSSLDHPQIAKRFEISNRLLSGMMPAPIIVWAEGDTRLQQLIWTLLLGDFTMAYLAFLNQIDPTPVPMIEKLKRELA